MEQGLTGSTVTIFSYEGNVFQRQKWKNLTHLKFQMLYIMTYACSYYARETEAEGSQIQDQPHLPSKFIGQQGLIVGNQVSTKQKHLAFHSVDPVHTIIKYIYPSHGENCI